MPSLRLNIPAAPASIGGNVKGGTQTASMVCIQYVKRQTLIIHLHQVVPDITKLEQIL